MVQFDRDKSLLAGDITISRPYRSDGVEAITITLGDDASGTHVLEVEIDLADFTLALTGLGHRPVKFRVWGVLVGTTREHKEIKVPVPRYFTTQDKAAVAQALKPFEVDGWMGRAQDLGNGHRRLRDKNGQQAYLVTFDRYVNAEGQPVDRTTGQPL